MKYGVDFFVVDASGCPIAGDGTLKDEVFYPTLRPFRYADGDGGWRLKADFTVDVLIDGVWHRITAHAGFDYDGASIPRFCRTVVGDKMAHDVIVAAMFHDLFYCAHHFLLLKPVADTFFRDVTGVYGASMVKRASVYEAVHLFGGGPWRKDSETKMDKYRPMLTVTRMKS